MVTASGTSDFVDNLSNVMDGVVVESVAGTNGALLDDGVVSLPTVAKGEQPVLSTALQLGSLLEEVAIAVLPTIMEEAIHAAADGIIHDLAERVVHEDGKPGDGAVDAALDTDAGEAASFEAKVAMLVEARDLDISD